MEKTVRKSKLRRDFIRFVMTTFFAVILLSFAVIVGCTALRESLLMPNTDKVYLNWSVAGCEDSPDKPVYGFSMLTLAEPGEVNPFYSENPSETRCFVLSRSYFTENDVAVSVTRVYNSPEALSPSNRALYYASGAAMIFVPMVLAFGGVLICGFAFYDRKLKQPIKTLFEATEKISSQDLDFTVDYRSDNELGALCQAFDQMRTVLRENNEKMWNMLVERRQLQSTVAHDLRNPIAIIQGHTEYLRNNIQNGQTDSEKLLPVLENISSAAKRLEHYTDSIRAINRIEELKISRNEIDFAEIFAEIDEDFSVTPKQDKVAITCVNAVGDRKVNIDKQALFRILENLVSNAMRFAESEIRIVFVFDKGDLVVTVSDDGCGFSESFISDQKSHFIIKSDDGEHSGIGLAVSGILTRKHGGELICRNNQKGAFVEFSLKSE